MNTVSALARPKINLFLHVIGCRSDGYHMLESLVVFAETGDRVSAEPSTVLSLSLGGPFAVSLETGGENLVLKAALALQNWAERHEQQASGAALRLEKNLPVASGIGGGSADAAATLIVLRRLWRLEINDSELAGLALLLGADVPVCLESRTRVMRGIGEALSEAPELPRCWMVLVNPQRQISTPAVFAALDHINPEPVSIPERFASPQALADWLSETRNDLQAPACEKIAPEIGSVLNALSQDALFARMSGSGATCFGLFGSREAALAAAARLQQHHSDWWVEAAAMSVSEGL